MFIELGCRKQNRLKMGLLDKLGIDKLIEALSKLVPENIQLIKIDNHIEKFVLGNEEYNVENGFINVGGQKIKLEKKEETIEFTLPNGTKLQRLRQDAKKNIKFLDTDKKVFTRSDLGGTQIPLLAIDEQHEKIIKKLKQVLEKYRNNTDLGCLLIASTIIKKEDKIENLENDEEDIEIVSRYYKKIKIYKKIGHMIYNLFRSKILENEIIPHLEALQKAYKTLEEVKRQFLIYWYDIIEAGYPTAYFVKMMDNKEKLYKEISWRFDRGENSIDVYSRTGERNHRVREWLANIQKKEKIKIKESKAYRIGNSVAIKFTAAKS